MSAKIFIVNGAPMTGKTTFQNYFKEITNNEAVSISTIDYIKNVAIQCGWNGEKDEKSREYLSRLKQLFNNWLDSTLYIIKKSISELDENIKYVFIDCREVKEIQRLQKELNASSILIRNKRAESLQYNNNSDNLDNILNYDYDYIFYNDGSIDDLKSLIKDFIKDINKK